MKIFTQKQYLKIHEKVHYGQKKSYSCSVCSKLFTTLAGLKYHIKMHGKDSKSKSFECNTCEKHFEKASLLKIHIRTHTGDKPFKCGTCDKTFSQSGSQRAHEKRHLTLKIK